MEKRIMEILQIQSLEDEISKGSVINDIVEDVQKFADTLDYDIGISPPLDELAEMTVQDLADWYKDA